MCALASGAGAAWPEKPIKIIVPYPPGGLTDAVGRQVAAVLAERLKQPVVIENVAGGGGNIGADRAAKSPADGYTLYLGNNATVGLNTLVYKQLTFDPLKDLAPVTMLAESQTLLVVHPSVPAKTVPELVALAKAKPGTLNFGSTGTGGVSHLAGEMLNTAAGIQMTHVAYKGTGPALTDLLGGPDPGDVQRHGAAAREGGQAARAGGDGHQALARRAGDPDDGGGRRGGLRDLQLVRPVRARGHAGGDHRPAQPRAGAGAEGSGDAVLDAGARLGGREQQSGGIRGLHPQGRGEVGARGEGRRPGAGMTIKLYPVTESFACEVGDVDLAQPLSTEDEAAIKAAFWKYAVLVFPEQTLTSDQHVAFSERFGPMEPNINTYAEEIKKDRIDGRVSDVSNLGEDNEILPAESRKRRSGLANRLWHTDSIFRHVPARASLLYARSVAPIGGHTEFADMRAAWDALPEAKRKKLEGLKVFHSIFHSRAKLGMTDYTERERASLPGAEQVLVRTIPQTGRKALYSRRTR